MKQKKQDLNIFARAEAERRRENLRNSYLCRMLSRIGTSIAVLSHGKLAFNKYLASAIKNGIDVRNPDACIVVNFGLNTTDIVTIFDGQSLSQRSISISCDNFFDDIIVHMALMHKARISESIAKNILDSVGSAISELDEAPEPYVLRAPNMITGLPMRIPISHQEIAHCLFRDFRILSRYIERTYVSLPHEIQASIIQRGIFLTGEGAAVRGLAQCIEESLQIPCTAIVSSEYHQRRVRND